MNLKEAMRMAIHDMKERNCSTRALAMKYLLAEINRLKKENNKNKKVIRNVS